ncbi:MAG: ABC transporter permease subunit [Polyangiaceae bacterium]
MSPTFIIAKRELRANFDTAVPYVVLCLGLPVLAFFFFFYEGGFWQANRASVESLVMFASRGIGVLASVLTMRVMAEEKRSGTLEMLITLPVKEHQVIIGKFLGTWAVVVAALLATLLFPLMMFVWPWHLGPIDAGPVISGYIGLVLASMATVALGMLISSLTESQMIAFFVTFLLVAILTVSGMFVNRIDNEYARIAIAFISFDARMTSFARGLITTRDVLYFVSLTVGFLGTAFWALERRKWA